MVEDHRVTDMVIVGDAFARPILAALDEAESAEPYRIESLRQISSSGVMWSQEIKQGLLRHHDMVLADLMGSTEGGMGGSITTRKNGSSTAKFELNEGVVVITDDDRFVEPGSNEMGKIATSAFVPLGYYKSGKVRSTFREVHGVRYSFPGDYATVEADAVSLCWAEAVPASTPKRKVFPRKWKKR